MRNSINAYLCCSIEWRSPKAGGFVNDRTAINQQCCHFFVSILSISNYTNVNLAIHTQLRIKSFLIQAYLCCDKEGGYFIAVLLIVYIGAAINQKSSHVFLIALLQSIADQQ